MITIKTDKLLKTRQNFWNNFHFHPTDAIEDDWGKRYLDKAAEDNIADTVRMYAMFEDIVTMDEDGRLCYDFTENDVRMDYMVEKGFNLLVSYNFIPRCIAEYNDKNNTEVRVSSRYKGKTICTIPPKDWSLWGEICRAYTQHIVERYGIDRVKNWYLQCFNEPDVSGFFLAPMGSTEEAKVKRCEEYVKMYKAFAEATKGVDKRLKIGGPTASNGRIFEYWLKFIKENNIPADFACGHAYGTNPKRINDGIKQIGADNNVEICKSYIARLDRYYPEMEFVMDEFGASGAGFCNLLDCPKLIFRENEIFAAFLGQLVTRLIRDDVRVSRLMMCMSGSHQPHQRPGEFVEFNGFRSFFTEHFITKPVYNAYRLVRKLHSGILAYETAAEHLDVLPTTDGENYSILLAYADGDYSEDLPALTETLTLPLDGKYRVTTWIIDADHVNPYRMWQRENMPDHPDEAQLEALRTEGILRPASETVIEASGTASIPVTLGCNGLAMVEIHKI